MSWTRRKFLKGAAMAAGAAAIGSTLSETYAQATDYSGSVFNINNWPPLEWRLFADSSPWNQIRDHSSVDPNSDVYIASLMSFGPPIPQSVAKTGKWGFPIYWGRKKDPLFTIQLGENNTTFEQEIQGTRVHCPAKVVPSSESDSVFKLVEQVNGYTYHFQRASVDYTNRVINAWRSYRLPTYGNGFHDIHEPPTGTLPIRPEELAAGYVNHTIGMHCYALSGHSVAPYDKSGTKGVNPSQVPADQLLSMGNVVFLDMAIAEIDALHVPVWQKAILKGLADHGAVVGWNGSTSWTLTFEGWQDRTAYGKPNPYVALGLPDPLDYSHALDEVGGWGAKLKVLAPFPRPS